MHSKTSLNKVTKARVVKRKRRNSGETKEIKRLQSIVPSVAGQKGVSEVEVVEQAARLIDDLHRQLIEKLRIPAHMVMPRPASQNNNDSPKFQAHCPKASATTSQVPSQVPVPASVIPDPNMMVNLLQQFLPHPHPLPTRDDFVNGADIFEKKTKVPSFFARKAGPR